MVFLLGFVLATGLLVAAIQHRQRAFLVQYLFFVRYTLVLAAALMLGPVLAVTVGQDMLGNLFTLDAGDVAIVTGLGLFAASTVVYTFNLIFALGHARTRLPFFRPRAEGGHGHLDRQRRIAEAIARWHFGITALVMLPLAVILIVECSEGAFWGTSGVVLGVVVSMVVAWVGSSAVVRRTCALFPMVARASRRLKTTLGRPDQTAPDTTSGDPHGLHRSPPRHSVMRWLAETFEDGYRSGGNDERRWHVRALFFFGLSVALYVAGYFVVGRSFDSPDRTLANAIPALAYLMVLVMVFGWLLPFLSFYFDKFRVPPVLVLVVAWAFSYTFGAKDHYFALARVAQPASALSPGGPPPPPDCGLSPGRAAQAWADRARRHGRKSTMVVVAASGGGITASL